MNQEAKIEEIGETVRKLDSIEVPAIRTSMAKFALAEELRQIRIEIEKVLNY